MVAELLTESQATQRLVRLVEECRRFDFAVAWAGKNVVVDTMLQHRKKGRHLVIGTHMYQTDPQVLRWFSKVDAAKCMPPSGRLFHPKIYLFHMPDGLTAVVGSHNLTGGAFGGKNIEASLLLRGLNSDKVIRELSAFVLENWEVAHSIDKDDFLFSYEIQYNINKAKREALSRFHQLKKPRQAASNPSPLDLSWMEIVKAIKAEKTLEERLSVLEHAATLFRRNKSFDRMTTNERRAIAGTYGRVEEGVEGLPWGWFGTMVGQGDFKNLVNDLPRGLSAALDKIPLNGDVEEGQFGAFADAFAKAFKGKAHKGGVATASRLLSMKRPDVFVGVNGANRRGLCAGFGVAFSTLHLGNYWERIVVPIQLSPWWRRPRPLNASEGRIWDNRAALLDCIYYDPDSK